jgi:hypothetical protein
MSDQPEKDYRIKIRIPRVDVKNVNRRTSGDVDITLHIDRDVAKQVSKEAIEQLYFTDEPLQVYMVEAYEEEGSQQPDKPAVKKGERKVLNDRQKLVYRIRRLIEDELGWTDEFKRAQYAKWIDGKTTMSDMTIPELQKLLSYVEEEVGQERLDRFNDQADEEAP